MIIEFKVTVNVGRIDAQPLVEFHSEDCKAFVPYLKEKIEDALKETWQYNARVDNVSVKQVKS